MNGKDDSDALPRKGYFRCLCFQRGCRFYSEPCSWRMRKHRVSEGRGRAEGHLSSCQVLGIPPAAATQSASIMEVLSSPPHCQWLWAKTNDGALRSLLMPATQGTCRMKLSQELRCPRGHHQADWDPLWPAVGLQHSPPGRLGRPPGCLIPIRQL